MYYPHSCGQVVAGIATGGSSYIVIPSPSGNLSSPKTVKQFTQNRKLSLVFRRKVIKMKSRSKPEKGYILAVTFVLCTIILFLLVFTGMTSTQIKLLDDVLYAEKALDASYALENAAIAKMMYDPKWDEGFTRYYYKDDMATAYMVFNQDKKNLPVPYSYNNFDGRNNINGWDGRTIPPGYVNMVIPAMSPDSSEKLTQINFKANNYLRQSMVHLYRDFFFEDFNKDGDGKSPRHEWTQTCDPPLHPDRFGNDTVAPVHYKDSFCYMGQKKRYWHDIFVEAGKEEWQDYDMEAVVAYYGYGSFGMYINAEKPQEGYGVLFAPRAGDPGIPGNYTLQGGSILFCYTKKIRTWTKYSPDPYWEPFDVDNSRVSMDWYSNNSRHNPFMKEENKTRCPDVLYAMWKIILSSSKIKDDEGKEKQVMQVTLIPIEVSGNKDDLDLKLREDQKWTSDEIAIPDDVSKKGKAGIYCEPNTMIAVTNIKLKKKGEPLVSIPASWHNK